MSEKDDYTKKALAADIKIEELEQKVAELREIIQAVYDNLKHTNNQGLGMGIIQKIKRALDEPA